MQQSIKDYQLLDKQSKMQLDKRSVKQDVQFHPLAELRYPPVYIPGNYCTMTTYSYYSLLYIYLWDNSIINYYLVYKSKPYNSQNNVKLSNCKMTSYRNTFTLLLAKESFNAHCNNNHSKAILITYDSQLFRKLIK